MTSIGFSAPSRSGSALKISATEALRDGVIIVDGDPSINTEEHHLLLGSKESVGAAFVVVAREWDFAGHVRILHVFPDTCFPCFFAKDAYNLHTMRRKGKVIRYKLKVRSPREIPDAR